MPELSHIDPRSAALLVMDYQVGWIAAPSLPATAIPFAFSALNTGLRGLTSG